MKRNSFKRFNGFTLVELVVVLIMVGILAATVAPRFFTSNGYEEISIRAELISKLRASQLRAMQQTAYETCHNILITSDIAGLLATDNSNNCDMGNFANATTSVNVSGSNVSFSSSDLDNLFSFDNLGRPIGCENPCQIMVNGSETLTVQIESEGYIHAL